MRSALLTVTFVITLALAPASLAAPHARDHRHDGPAAASTASKHQGHTNVEAYEAEFEAVIAEGRGLGMAFAADRNGYPGPIHVLELGEQLRLTPAQEATVRTLLDRMFAASKPKGQALIAAERRLQALFGAGHADEARVRAAVVEVERLRAELRLIHLLTHLETRDVLTDEQRRAYHAARWGNP
jgi:Spy/CpxP family protein refolding chaperone